MPSDSPVTLRKTTYRGAEDFHLAWQEHGKAHELTFTTEAEAVVEMARIEERLRTGAAAGQGLTVNPFGALTPYITSKDVHFAALRLQPKGLAFRECITDYVAAKAALQRTGVGVPEAAQAYAEAWTTLLPYDTSLAQAVFEWAELKRQLGDRPLFEVLRAYLRDQPSAKADNPSPPGA
jgi:hypothetical protein